MSMLAKLMSTKLVYVGPDETIGEMHKLLDALPIHHLLVMEGGVLLGVVSDREIYKHMSPFANTKLESQKDRFSANLPAARIMKKNIITVNVHAGVREAADKMVKNNESLLPVVDDAGRVIGVLSWKDILRFISS